MHDHAHGHAHHHDGTGRSVVLNLIVNVGLTVLKWVAFAYTGSPSLFGEAMHSSADSFNPVILGLGHLHAKRRRDDEHQFGHARASFVWSLIAALMMLTFGAGLTAWHGIETLIAGTAPSLSRLSLGIMIIALLAEGYTCWRAWRDLHRRHGSLKDIASTTDTTLLGVLQENGVDALGVLVAISGYGLYWLTGHPIWDALGSLVIAVIIAGSSLHLIRRNISLLIGEGLDRREVGKLRSVVNALPEVRQVEDLKTTYVGVDHLLITVAVRLNTDLYWLQHGVGHDDPRRDDAEVVIGLVRGDFAGIENALRRARHGHHELIDIIVTLT